ncbi:MAG TPA: tetratricopeptide repeat protein [bacterium]|nr:tetratricopeptide repeat protein [bacterium]
MDDARFQVTEEVLDLLQRRQVNAALLQALRRLVGSHFDEEAEFLRALYALDPPPRSNREAAIILRCADGHFQQALVLLEAAYRQQMRGELRSAEQLYQRSIRAFPTAEAHTFLGWTYSFEHRYEEAIAECQQAIRVDPDFGNPYNDIGAYLIALERPREAVPWLLQATRAPRYEPRHFPWANLGRVYEQLGQADQALDAYLKAHELEPSYHAAREGIARLTVPLERMN